jgi:hypothetical protein
MGRTDIEDALLRLDSLTKEESLMAAAKNLEVTYHVDGNVKDIKVLAEDIDENVKAVKERTRSFLSPSPRTDPSFDLVQKQEPMNKHVCYTRGIIVDHLS